MDIKLNTTRALEENPRERFHSTAHSNKMEVQKRLAEKRAQLRSSIITSMSVEENPVRDETLQAFFPDSHVTLTRLARRPPDFSR